MRTSSPCVTLLSWRADGITLGAAVRAFAGVAGAGFLLAYSPRSSVLAKLAEDGSLTLPDGPLPTAEVFEARAFNASAELRWLRLAEGGAGVVLAESAAGVEMGSGWRKLPEIADLEPVELRYVLWGTTMESSGLPDDWSRLSEARIGSFCVPIAAVGPKRRFVLTALEYLGVADQEGNVAVVEERIHGLEVVAS